jgi:hypothetical protein
MPFRISLSSPRTYNIHVVCVYRLGEVDDNCDGRATYRSSRTKRREEEQGMCCWCSLQVYQCCGCSGTAMCCRRTSPSSNNMNPYPAHNCFFPAGWHHPPVNLQNGKGQQHYPCITTLHSRCLQFELMSAFHFPLLPPPRYYHEHICKFLRDLRLNLSVFTACCFLPTNSSVILQKVKWWRHN